MKTVLVLVSTPLDLTVTSLTNGSKIELKSKNSFLRPVIVFEFKSVDNKKGPTTMITMKAHFNRKSALFQVSSGLIFCLYYFDGTDIFRLWIFRPVNLGRIIHGRKIQGICLSTFASICWVTQVGLSQFGLGCCYGPCSKLCILTGKTSHVALQHPIRELDFRVELVCFSEICVEHQIQVWLLCVILQFGEISLIDPNFLVHSRTDTVARDEAPVPTLPPLTSLDDASIVIWLLIPSFVEFSAVNKPFATNRI